MIRWSWMTRMGSGVDLTKVRGSGSVMSSHQTTSGASEKLVLPSIFDTNLSSSMMWNLQSYPTTAVNERMWHFRWSKHILTPRTYFQGVKTLSIHDLCPWARAVGKLEICAAYQGVLVGDSAAKMTLKDIRSLGMVLLESCYIYRDIPWHTVIHRLTVTLTLTSLPHFWIRRCPLGHRFVPLRDQTEGTTVSPLAEKDGRGMTWLYWRITASLARCNCASRHNTVYFIYRIHLRRGSSCLEGGLSPA